jgi:2-polyprenyl-3-methyl-5-hydroxy-6-metoxy-1,4-benzoquinol methylase/uncharacterized protein (DUF2062 family)
MIARKSRRSYAAVVAEPSKLKRAWARLRGGELTPKRAFWSVAVGLLIGVQPTPGLHLPVVLALCLPLRLDAAVSYLAANISIPPIAPFLWIASVQIGSLLLAGHTVPLSPEGARELVHAPGPMLAALVVGSPVLGVALGIVGGTLAYAMVRVRRGPEAKTPFDEAVQRTAERFARASKRRADLHYVRSKLRRDGSVRAIAERAPLGDVLDLGCGRGQLAIMLLELGAATRVRGVDWDDAKIALAARAAEGLDARFERADVRSAECEPADTVLLVDVLHYVSAPEQDALLARAADRVRPGGRLFVRDASIGYGWRSRLTLAAERIGTAVRFNRGERVLFRDVARDLLPLLEAKGFACSVEPCWAGTPFANVLVVATR